MFDHQLRDTVPLLSTPHIIFPPAFPLPPILPPSDPTYPEFRGPKVGCFQRVGQPSTVYRPQQPKDDINMCQPSNSNREPKKQNKTNNLATHITTVVSWTNFFGRLFFVGTTHLGWTQRVDDALNLGEKGGFLLRDIT